MGFFGWRYIRGPLPCWEQITVPSTAASPHGGRGSGVVPPSHSSVSGMATSRMGIPAGLQENTPCRANLDRGALWSALGPGRCCENDGCPVQDVRGKMHHLPTQDS
eukprot:gene2244-biopygen15516